MGAQWAKRGGIEFFQKISVYKLLCMLNICLANVDAQKQVWCISVEPRMPRKTTKSLKSNKITVFIILIHLFL